MGMWISLTLVPSIRVEVKRPAIRSNVKRTNFFRCTISNRGTTGATIEPQNQWPWLWSTTHRCLHQPVKQCSPTLLIHSHIARILSKPHILWLSWQLGNSISLLIFNGGSQHSTNGQNKNKIESWRITRHNSA